MPLGNNIPLNECECGSRSPQFPPKKNDPKVTRYKQKPPRQKHSFDSETDENVFVYLCVTDLRHAIAHSSLEFMGL
jgi:hypothetical protein